MLKKKLMLNFVLLLCISYARCNNTMEPYVIGGDFTDISHFPHSVFLNIDCVTTYICGSSILNQKILLTAAHCINDCKRRWQIEGYAGHENLSKVKVMRTIKKILKHEKYNDQSMANDIALLYLERSLPLGKYIQRVTIRRWHSPNEIASVAGWGIVNRVTNKDTIHLKRALQKLISPRVCASFGGMFTGMMCAKSPEKNTSPASGDSGSALITKDMQQIGLVSYIFSEYPNMPIYTNVSHYYNWINTKSRSLHCS
ncbi:chymotrypsin [Papilio machaon]|uniref:chymotrypsin n=1 Tax=Papilio machaon TaxID=76193 RepID=UPI001E66505C|nr:chymotrypsin [Papilio machaon]